MRDPAPLAEARELIRAGRFDAAVERLVAALPDLPVEYHRQACAYAGFAHYFAERWTESRNRWSGILARPSQARQNRVVAAIRESASSTSCGDTRPSSHEREQ